MDWLSFILGLLTLVAIFLPVLFLATLLGFQRWPWAERLLRRIGILAVLLLCSPALALDQPNTPAPVSGPAPASVSIVGGASAALGGGGEAGIKPLVLISFEGPVAETHMSPRLLVGLDLGAGKGQAVSLSDPATFRTLTFRLSVVQPIKGLFVAPYFGGGFATRVESDPEPLDRTARWWSAGLRIAGARGWLEVGAGLDDRLGDGYQPTAHARGALLLGDRGGVNGWLIGEAILGLRIGYSGTEGRVDVVTLGLGVGR